MALWSFYSAEINIEFSQLEVTQFIEWNYLCFFLMICIQHTRSAVVESEQKSAKTCFSMLKFELAQTIKTLAAAFLFIYRKCATNRNWFAVPTSDSGHMFNGAQRQITQVDHHISPNCDSRKTRSNCICLFYLRQTAKSAYKCKRNNFYLYNLFRDCRRT